MLLPGCVELTYVVTGCTAQPTRAERHAKNFVYEASDDVDPNFRTRKYNSVQSSISFFKQFYELGKAGKSSGMNTAEAEQRIDYFNSAAFTDSFERTSR